MAVVIEPVIHLDTHVVTLRVVFGEFCQDVDLELGRVSILLDILNYLDGENLVLLKIFTSDHFTESSLSELCCYLVSANLKFVIIKTQWSDLQTCSE